MLVSFRKRDRLSDGSAGVALKVNLRNALPSDNKIYQQRDPLGIETEDRHHQKCNTVVLKAQE